MKRTTLAEFKKKALADPEVKAQYDTLVLSYASISECLKKSGCRNDGLINPSLPHQSGLQIDKE